MSDMEGDLCPVWIRLYSDGWPWSAHVVTSKRSQDLMTHHATAATAINCVRQTISPAIIINIADDPDPSS